MDNAPPRPARARVYRVLGFVVAVLFLALAVAAYLGGAGPVIAFIALTGGILCLAATIITLARARS